MKAATEAGLTVEPSPAVIKDLAALGIVIGEKPEPPPAPTGGGGILGRVLGQPKQPAPPKSTEPKPVTGDDEIPQGQFRAATLAEVGVELAKTRLALAKEWDRLDE